MKEIELTKGKVAIIDDEDYDRVNQHSWYYSKTGYPCGDHTKGRSKLSRFILGITDSTIYVDHIDGNTLNNQKSNLRACSNTENCRNARRIKIKDYASKYKGVTFAYWAGNRWRAHITVNRRGIHIGYYDTEEEAARAYNGAAICYFGEFACINENVGITEFNEPKSYKERTSSKYRGVNYFKKGNYWVARITYKKEIYFLGCFKSEKEAALAYNDKATELLGNKAKLNKIED